MQKALKAQLHLKWSSESLATKFCYIMLAIKIIESQKGLS